MCGVPADRALTTRIVLPGGETSVGTSSISSVVLDDLGRRMTIKLRELILVVRPGSGRGAR
jgi:hypothetical protein